MKTLFLCLNIYFGGQAIQWIPFQNCIYEGRLKIQDGRPGTFDLIYLFKKYHWKVFNCEVEINVLKLRVAKNHLRMNFVDGKHNLLSINHISSDLEGHQVQERNFKFGIIS